MVKKEIVSVVDYEVTIITSGLLHQNCFLVKHLPSNDMLLIDPGGAVPEIISEIESEGGLLKIVLLTHAHFDHVGGVKEICDKYGLPFWIHNADIKLLKRAPIYAISMEKRNIEISSDYKYLNGPVEGWGGDTIQIINTPGHTPGSVCFNFGKMVFTGDIILMDHDKPGLPGFNEAELSESVSMVLKELPGDTVFFPGHGKASSIDAIRLWWKEMNSGVDILKN